VAQQLAEEHGLLYKKAMRSRAAAQVQYDKAVQMCSYAVGDRVLIVQTPGETESGLRLLWMSFSSAPLDLRGEVLKLEGTTGVEEVERFDAWAMMAVRHRLPG
jgi:hypothetical protein